jgi:hypothetical protein
MKIRKALTDAQAGRYRASTFREKRRILDEFVASTGYNRKYASHLLARWGLSTFMMIDGKPVELTAGARKRAPRPGKRIYDQRVDEALKRLWMLLDQECGKRLAFAIREHISRLAPELHIDADLVSLLRSMSPATIDRHLAKEHRGEGIKGLCMTKPVSGLKRLIPIRTSFEWVDSPPGFFQADTVSHDGGNSSGDFCFTLDLVDVASGWTELRPLLNKACRWVKSALADIRQSLPFPLLGINSDSGGEFINKTIYDFCAPDIAFTRSRPGKKNDNCHVECKNDTAVRQHVGYARFSGEAARQALADVYQPLCLLINHVYPSMKLVKKTRVGAKVRKQYDNPRTPYQRLMMDQRVRAAVKEALQCQHETIDILALTATLDQALERLADVAAHYPCRPLLGSVEPVGNLG